MFADISPNGSGDPLGRKQLKWLLAGLAVLLVIVFLFGISASLKNRFKDASPRAVPMPQAQSKEAEVRSKLETLSAQNSELPQVSPEAVQTRLEELSAEESVPEPPETDVREQLESLESSR